jgi:RHS repeat-associated protein
MLLPNRHGSVDSDVYRYGFEGQERDDELKGAGYSYNYTFRMHDPRLVRFFTMDPLDYKYAHYTPYSFAGNKLISYTELEGLEEEDAVGRMFGAFIQWSKSKLVLMSDDDQARDPFYNVKLQTINYVGRVHSDGFTPEEVHIILDGMGAIPIIGEPLDVANGVLYAVEGDYVNASFSFFAVIPIIGEAGKILKYTIKGVDAVVIAGRSFKRTNTATRYLKISDNFPGQQKVADAIWDSGGKRLGQNVGANKLAKALGTTGTTKAAHHLIPVELLQNNKYVQQAVEEGFDFNGIVNGLGLEVIQHSGKHPNDYAKGIIKMINDAREATPNATAKETLETVTGALKPMLDGTGIKVNDLFKG